MTVQLSSQAAPGVHRIPLPTPFQVGDVNCYLLTGEPLTLVDTGPNSGTALDRLDRALDELGLRIGDLELIVLTHQHMDHEGLLEILARRCSAQVAAFAPLQPWLADYHRSARADDIYAQRVMSRHGLPRELVALIGVLSAGMHAYGSSGAVTRPLREGDRLAMGGRDFAVYERPGHSPSDIVFLHEHSGLMLGGDHLLSSISSNALVSRPLNGPLQAPRPQPLVVYAESLAATGMMPVKLILTGHGEAILEHRALIDSRLEAQRRRARQILRLISDRPLTAHEIALRMWGDVAITQAYLTLSETLGHIDLLLRDGRVHEFDADGLSRFQAA